MAFYVWGVNLEPCYNDQVVMGIRLHQALIGGPTDRIIPPGRSPLGPLKTTKINIFDSPLGVPGPWKHTN